MLLVRWRILFLLTSFTSSSVAMNGAAAVVPLVAPRTSILADQHEAFRAYVTTGEGAAAFARFRADFDRDDLARPFPTEPLTYGDPSPAKRTSLVADRWRDVQDICGLVAGVA